MADARMLLSRRRLLQIGAVGAFAGLDLPGLLAAERTPPPAGGLAGRAKSVEIGQAVLLGVGEHEVGP